ncbi:MAG: hypothetical protein ABIJ56_11515 [Pseudomonadota bacterium]
MKPLMEYGREDVVRFLYLEPLLQEQKVLVLGPENETVRQVFARLGCTSVKLMQPGREVLPDWDLTFLRGKRDLMEENKRILPFSAGAFDIIFIPSLEAIGDYRMVLSECARIAGRSGLVIISTRNAECTSSISQSGLEETPEIWSLDSLESLTGSYFKFVENVGQCPFLAYAVVSYDPDRANEGVRLDTSLMEERSEEPEFFMILCSQRSIDLKLSNAVYQVPVSEMTLVEAVEPGEPIEEGRDAAVVSAENDMLKKEVAEKNVLVSRLKTEIGRLEAEAEKRRQKAFDLRQKMEQERKQHQKEVLEKAMRRQVEKIPETWLAEREALTREAETLKKQIKALRSDSGQLESEIANLNRELRELKEQKARPQENPGRDRQEALSRKIDELKNENTALAADRKKADRDIRQLRRKLNEAGADPGKVQVDKLKQALEAREKLVRDLLHEMELMPQVGYGDDIPAGEEDVLGLVGRMDEMREDLAESGRTAVELESRLQDRQLAMQEKDIHFLAERREGSVLKGKIVDLVASIDLLCDLIGSRVGEAPDRAAASPAAGGADIVRRLHAVIQFTLDELEKITVQGEAGTVERDIALLWARVEEKRRMAELQPLQ